MMHQQLRRPMGELTSRRICQECRRLLTNSLHGSPAWSAPRPARVTWRNYARAAAGKGASSGAANAAAKMGSSNMVASQSVAASAKGKTAAAAVSSSQDANTSSSASTSSPDNSSSSSSNTINRTNPSSALRTAEARESALRAARMRRLAQQQDRLAEEARVKEEKKAYNRRYKTAARKWVSTIIALPIMLVTSYYLFDRLALGNQPKSLSKYREGRGDESES